MAKASKNHMVDVTADSIKWLLEKEGEVMLRAQLAQDTVQ